MRWRVEGKEGGGGQLVRKSGRREGWEAGAESFIEVYIYMPRVKREGAGGKYGCGWKMTEGKKVEGE